MRKRGRVFLKVIDECKDDDTHRKMGIRLSIFAALRLVLVAHYWTHVAVNMRTSLTLFS